MDERHCEQPDRQCLEDGLRQAGFTPARFAQRVGVSRHIARHAGGSTASARLFWLAVRCWLALPPRKREEMLSEGG